MSEQSLEQKIGAVLQDPQQLQQIMLLAQSLGFTPPQASPIPQAQQPSAAAFPSSAPPALESSTAVSNALSELLQKAGKLDRRQENLLNALKPFLKPDRREKIDRAMQAARISRLAGAALRGREQKGP